MKAHLIDTHLLVPRSRSSAKVKVKYHCHVSQKMGVSGALVFHKHILFNNVFYAICILNSFYSHISVVVCSFFEFGTVSKWCINEWVKRGVVYVREQALGHNKAINLNCV